jgi:hypothetical protein
MFGPLMLVIPAHKKNAFVEFHFTGTAARICGLSATRNGEYPDMLNGRHLSGRVRQL